MKKSFSLLMAGAITAFGLSLSSCKRDEDKKNDPAPTTPTTSKPTKDIFASANGVGTRTWSKDTVYVLNGFIFVNDGQTLTIEAGTVIKGQAGVGEEASALIVARGGKIMAEGTKEAPIIFTALADNTERTDDLPITLRGLWGGLILLGKAPINHANAETNIEGIPTSETRARYGGTDAADNSGSLKYISLRHGGTNIGAGNEINGLTMGGVGSATKISYIEVYGNDDDGFEWFGGTNNTSYLASIYNQDDSFDWDFGWRGENQFWVAFQTPNFTASDRGFESDGAHSGNLSSTVFSKPQIFNMTLIGQGNTGNNANCMFFTENSGGLIHNSIIMNFARGINLATVSGAGAGNQVQDRLVAGDLKFANNIWFNIGTNTTLDSVAKAAAGSNFNVALKDSLSNTGNVVADPSLGGTVATNFNPLPAATGAAFTGTRSAIPAGTPNGFTYQTANFKGAFGTENWLKGWTAADAYGILK